MPLLNLAARPSPCATGYRTGVAKLPDKADAKTGSTMLLFRFTDGSSFLLSARLVAPLLWCGQVASSVSGDLGPAALGHV